MWESINAIKRHKQLAQDTKFKTAKENFLKEHGSLMNVHRRYGIKYPMLKRVLSVRKPKTGRKQRVKERHDKIVAFTELDHVSIQFPEARIANNRYLRDSLRRVFEIYREEVGRDQAYCFSQFCKNRPKNVKLVGKTPHRMCVCDTCENVEIMARKLNQFHMHVPPTVGEALKKMWCKYGGQYPDLECVVGGCKQCGLPKLKETIDIPKNAATTPVSWYRWVTVVSEKGPGNEAKSNQNKGKGDTETNVSQGKKSKTDREKVKGTHSKAEQGKDNKDKPGKKTEKQRKVDCVPQHGVLSELIDLWLREVSSSSYHYFLSRWQSHQYNLFRKTMLPGTVLQVVDFAQDYMHTLQDEATGHHWQHATSTMFACVSEFRCPDPKCTKLISWEQMFFAQNKNKTHFAVDSFMRKGVQELRENGVEIRDVHRWSDNCGKQFKSKGPFMRLASSSIPMVLSYFGERHGKSRADGFSGRVKVTLVTATRSRLDGEHILTAADCVKVCRKQWGSQEEKIAKLQKKECLGEKHTISSFHQVEEHDMSLEVPKSGISGSKQFHSLRSTGNADIVETRKVSCTCRACYYGDSFGECRSPSYASEWVQHNRISKRKNQDMITNAHYPIIQMVVKLIRLPQRFCKRRVQVTEQLIEQLKVHEPSHAQSVNCVESMKDFLTRNGVVSDVSVKLMRIPQQLGQGSVQVSEQLLKTLKCVSPAKAYRHARTRTQIQKPDPSEAMPKRSIPSSKQIIDCEAAIDWLNASRDKPRDIELSAVPVDYCHQDDNSDVEDWICSQKDDKMSGDISINTHSSEANDCMLIGTSSPVNDPLLHGWSEKYFTNVEMGRRVQGKQVKSTCNWDAVYNQIFQCENFSDLARLSSELQREQPDVPFTSADFRKMRLRHDSSAIIPADAPPGRVALYTEGDGNCLLRAVSTALIGNESMYLELRCRVTMHLASHSNLYLSEQSMSMGIIDCMNVGSNLETVPFFLAISPVASGHLSREQVFEREVFHYRAQNIYSGPWQIAALANVLKRPILSVFPHGQGKRPLNRAFLPEDDQFRRREPVVILWIKLSECVYHFVPLIEQVGLRVVQDWQLRYLLCVDILIPISSAFSANLTN